MAMRIEVPALREEIWQEVLPSGLACYVLPKPGFATRYASFSTRYGSCDQTFMGSDGQVRETPAGIAHFLEHKLFEEEDGNVSERFSALGAMANAYTNYGATSYLFSTTEHFQEALDLLLHFVQEPYFTEANVHKEQGIIAEELRMYLDDPRSVVFQNLLAALYQRHPVRVEIGGTLDSIQHIGPQELFLCHRAFYQPGNMVLMVAGDVDPAEVFGMARRAVGAAGAAAVRRIYPEEPRAVAAEMKRQRMAVGVPLIAIGFKDDPAPSEDALRREVTMEILLDVLFGSSSEIHRQLYEEGLIGQQFSSSYFSGDGYAASVLGGPTPDPDRLLARVEGLLAEAVAKGLDPRDVERSRRRSLGEFVALFNAPEAVAHAFSEYALRGLDLMAVYDLLRTIDADDVAQRLREQFALPRRSVSIVERAD